MADARARVEDPPDARARSRRIAAALVALFVVFAALTRLTSIDSLLPQILLRDGLAVVVQVERLRSGEWPATYDQRWGAYPHLLSRIVACFPAPTAPPGASLREHLSCAIEPWVHARFVNVLASLLAIPATYVLARRFLDRKRSVLAAGLIATSLGVTVHALQERPHPLLMLSTLLATLAALRLHRHGTLGAHVGAAVAGAASIGALHSGVIALVPIALARWLRRDRRPIGRLAGFAIVAAAAALAIWFFYPFIRGPQPPEAPGGAVSMRGQNLHFDRFHGHGLLRLLDWMWWFEPFITVLAIASLVWLAVRAWRARGRPRKRPTAELWIVLAFAVPYFLVFALYDESAGRYVLPVPPFLACAAAAVAPRSWWSLVLVAPAAACTARMAFVRARPDTIEEAALVVERAVRTDERIVVVPDFDLPLATDERVLPENLDPGVRSIWMEYEARQTPGAIPPPRYDVLLNPLRRRRPPPEAATDPLGVIVRSGARWVLISCEVASAPQFRCRNELMSIAQPVGRFSGRVVDDGDEPLVDPGRTMPFTVVPLPLRVWAVRALGPTLELYRLP